MFKVKDKTHNLCDHCYLCIADCPGAVEFNEGDPESDNVVSCDSFVTLLCDGELPEGVEEAIK